MIPNRDAIARRHFSASENDALRSLPPETRDLAFLLCWTRKEAYVKATGEGLRTPLQSFDIALHPDESPRILAIAGKAMAEHRWSVHHLEPAPGYVGALIHPGKARRLERRTADSTAMLLRAASEAAYP